MTCWYALNVVLNGNIDEIFAMLKVISDYQDEERKKPVYITSVNINGNGFDLGNLNKDMIQGEVILNADGPYGKYERIDEVDIFLDLANAAPGAYFKGTISGGDSYTQSDVSYELKDGLLSIDASFDSNDEEDDAWFDDFMDKLPYDDFISLFKVEGEDFDEDAYRDFINEISFDDNGAFDFSYEEFASTLEDYYDATTELDEEEYSELIETVIKERGITSQTVFLNESYNGGEKIHRVYNPVTKEYV